MEGLAGILMNKKDLKTLSEFQGEFYRALEEDFARTLSEKRFIRLFFINEGQPYTDGRNVIVDPALFELFADRKALAAIGKYLGWPPSVLARSLTALKIMTRAQTIHECLHLLYSDFPPPYCLDGRYDTENKKIAISLIANIIEDAYIEAVGCEHFDNMDYFLRFGRVANLLASAPHPGTAAMAFGKPQGIPVSTGKKRRTKLERFMDYLGYMSTMLLYPMVIQHPPRSDIEKYVSLTRQLFLDGSLAATPAERYQHAAQIYDAIYPLIPRDKKSLSALQKLTTKVVGYGTHAPDPGSFPRQSKGMPQPVACRAFCGNDGTYKQGTGDLPGLMAAVSKFFKEEAEHEEERSYEGCHHDFDAPDLGCSDLHRKIKVHESSPKPNLTLARAYQNILDSFSAIIRSQSGRLSKLLMANEEVKDDRNLFGAGICSTRLGDPRRRWWYRMLPSEEPLDLAVLLLVDGSGSMEGERSQAAVNAAIILHEVLRRQNIAHAVVEHRAEFYEPIVDINVLLNFNCRKDEKLNLLGIAARGDNRDAVALLWAERYLRSKADHKYKVIISISDGCPAHTYDEYCPPASISDTSEVVMKIQKRGIHVIGISLDAPGEDECYNLIREIYPNLVACDDMSRLPFQVIGIVSKLLSRQ